VHVGSACREQSTEGSVHHTSIICPPKAEYGGRDATGDASVVVTVVVLPRAWQCNIVVGVEVGAGLVVSGVRVRVLTE
jgi:hypothetical protein